VNYLSPIKITDCQNTLGESCIWDKDTGSLWWTDIEEKKIWQLNDKQKTKSFDLPDKAGFILPRKKEGFIIGFSKSICIAKNNFTTFEKICDVGPNIETLRVNDGKVDPFGGIVFGTMDANPDRDNRKPIASFYRLDPEGKLQELLSDITIANGIAFSNDFKMYFADTPSNIVKVLDIQNNNFDLHQASLFIDNKDQVGFPDGAVVDQHNNYWLCLVHGSCIKCYDRSGKTILEINLPTMTPTCCTFGGKNMNELFVTSLKKTNGSDNDGCLYKIVLDQKGSEQYLSTI